MVDAEIADQARDNGGDTFDNKMKFYLLLILTECISTGLPEKRPQGDTMPRSTLPSPSGSCYSRASI